MLLFSNWVLPSHTPGETVAIALRWFHLVAAITWIGMLYFLNMVNARFMRQVGDAERPNIWKHLTLPTLNVFRWSALATVFFGFWYWSQVYVAAAAHLEGKSPLWTLGLFILVWTAAFHIFKAVLIKPPSLPVLAVIVAVVLSAAGWAFVAFTPVGADDNHVLAIGVGGGLAWFMVSCVSGIVWPNNKKIIEGTLAGNPPANAALLARQVVLTSRINMFLSLPVIFFMAASSHYPILGK